MTVSDVLPKQICTDCRYQLDKTYIFRMKSKNAESKLKRHIRLINSGKISHVFEEEDDVDDYIDALNYVEKHEKEQMTEKARELEDMRKTFQQQLKQLKQSEMKLRTELRIAQEQLNQRSKEVDELQQQLEKQDITDDHDAGQYVVEMLEDEADIQLKGTKKSLKQEEIDIIDDDSHPGPSSSGRQGILDADMEEDDEYDLDDDDEDEDGDQIETRYNCDPEEYAAIEKAVRVRNFIYFNFLYVDRHYFLFYL